MAEDLTIARPYAEAAYERAAETGQVTAWADALRFAAQALGDAALHRVVTDPRIAPERVRGLLDEVGGGRFVGEIGAFMALLIANERLSLLPDIAALYHARQLAAEGAVDAEIVSAQPLTPEQRSRIQARLEQRFRRKVFLQDRVDPEIGAGAVIQVGDRVFDGSLRTRLASLATYLTK